MIDGWWPSYGMPSLITGVALGLAWALFSMSRRRRTFQHAGLEPHGQWLWFLTSLVSMSSYLTLVSAVSLMAYNELIAQEAMWLLLGSAGLAFCTALLFTRFELPRQVMASGTMEPALSKPIRKTA